MICSEYKYSSFSRALQTVNTLNFIDALNSNWLINGNNAVGDIFEFLEPWITVTGYPLIHVGLRQGGVLLTQVNLYIFNNVFFSKNHHSSPCN